MCWNKEASHLLYITSIIKLGGLVLKLRTSLRGQRIHWGWRYTSVYLGSYLHWLVSVAEDFRPKDFCDGAAVVADVEAAG